MKGVGLLVNGERAVQPMTHAEDIMPALHKGHKVKGTHDIVAQRREMAETKLAECPQAVGGEIELYAVRGKKTRGTSGIRLMLIDLQPAVVNGQIKVTVIGNNLQGSAFFAVKAMHSRNKSQRLFFVLAFEILAGEKIIHGQYLL